MPAETDEITWVSDQRLDVPEPGAAMTDRARTALMTQMSTETRRPRHRRGWLAGASAAVVGAAAAVALLVGGSGTGTHPRGSTSLSPGTSAVSAGAPSFTLLHLAHSVARSPVLPGNATLVRTTSTIVTPGRGSSSLTGYDLFEDDGDYAYGHTLTALRATARDPSAYDGLGRVVAAAAASADATPARAAERLLAADPHPTPRVGQGTPPLTRAQADRDLEGIEWQAIGSALEGGAGRPQVRAGALLAAAALPHTTVTTTTDAGQPVVRVTFDQGPDGLTESVTVNRRTGILVNQYSGGDAGGSVSNTSYQVSRVSAPSLDPVR